MACIVVVGGGDREEGGGGPGKGILRYALSFSSSCFKCWTGRQPRNGGGGESTAWAERGGAIHAFISYRV